MTPSQYKAVYENLPVCLANGATATIRVDTARSYILGMVDAAGNILNGGPKAPVVGHVVITEPNRREERPGPNGTRSFAIRAVEATGGHTPGLWESWYTLRRVRNNVFDLDREDMLPGSRCVAFKIAPAP
jgi:hypothetical protein